MSRASCAAYLVPARRTIVIAEPEADDDGDDDDDDDDGDDDGDEGLRS